jgi:hypothetical protein
MLAIFHSAMKANNDDASRRCFDRGFGIIVHPGASNRGDVMKFKPILFIAIAIGLYYVGHSLELRGDAAPAGANGV